MKRSGAAKSSFTLPPQEVHRVRELKKRLRLPSNTAVVRMALLDLQKKLDRDLIREQFRKAAMVVRQSTEDDLRELDHLAGEGIGED